MAEEYIKREDAARKIARANAHDICAEYGQHFSLDKVNFESEMENALKFLADIPSADVAPVVRCKDCKCWTEWSNGTGSCSRFALDWIGTDADDFCSMGERKDDESERD